MNLDWISQEARHIHDFFVTIFYLTATTLIAIGVLVEYGKMPLGGMPGFTQLVGRAVIAVILLVAYPEISNAVTLLGDEIAAQIGDLNSIPKVLEAVGDTFKNYSWSWSSPGDLIVWIFSFIFYFVLYVTVFFFDAALVYCIILLYTFSPLLIVMFILPQTASATSGLFRTLFEITAWKVVWGVLAALLWSTSLQHFTAQDNSNFVTQIALSLILALSILMTPMIVRSLISGGLSQAVTQMAGMSMGALTGGYISPAGFSGVIQRKVQSAGRGTKNLAAMPLKAFSKKTPIKSSTKSKKPSPPSTPKK